MSEGILGNATGGFGFPKTYILTDENGNELTGVYVESETIFTATDNDVREGKVYAGDGGKSVGQKNIPSYYTSEGRKIVTDGSKFTIPTPNYDYTRLQAIICPYNTTPDNSVASEKIVVNNNVYNVQSTTSISLVEKDQMNACIDLGITNVSGGIYVIRYFTYKEIY
jgi:hypothetical protein